MQEQIKIMLKQQKLGDAGKKGTIVNMASMSGLIGVPYAAPYSSTKHAVRKSSSQYKIVSAADSSTRSSASPNQQPWSTHMKAFTSPPSLPVSSTRECRYWKRVTTVAHTRENKLLLCTPWTDLALVQTSPKLLISCWRMTSSLVGWLVLMEVSLQGRDCRLELM